jgi:hypothetical protein
MSNLPERSSWTGPANSGSVNESGGGNSEMLTLVPIEAKGGITLHPGPGPPLAAGPGPSAARGDLFSACSGLFAAIVAVENSAIAAAVTAMSAVVGGVDFLLNLS